MKILLNASTLVQGGSLQACASFISEILKDVKSEKEWFFVVSTPLITEIEKMDIKLVNYIVLKKSPSKSLKVRKYLLELEKKVSPNIVFTFFGPAYVKFRSYHIMGVADGWVTHSNLQTFKLAKMGFKGSFRRVLEIIYKIRWYKFANWFVVEAECSKRGVCHRLGVDTEVSIVSNNCSALYADNNQFRPFPGKDHVVNILLFSGNYSHKGHGILIDIARKLRDFDIKFRFTVTLPKDSIVYKQLRAVFCENNMDAHLHNVGKVSLTDGPELYKKHDICLMPTILESFSATYPEAMSMGLPIITSDLEFAHDICGDSALYFIPMNGFDAAMKIAELLRSKLLWNYLILNGKKRLKQLPTSHEKYRKYINLLDACYKAEF